MSNTKDHVRFFEGIENVTFYSKDEIKERLTDNYVRGLIDGEGYFGISGKKGKPIPCFVLKMHVRDKELIEAVRDYLQIDNRVYEYKNQGRHFAMIIVRDIPTLKNKIIPFFRHKLLGHKGIQFEWWLKKFPYLNSLIYRNSNKIL